MTAPAAAPPSGPDGLSATIRTRVDDVRARIAAACDRVGRAPSSVRIVAVTKTHPPEVVRAAVAAGLTDLGENRVQEMIDKMADLGPELADAGVGWHFVGQLQSNKAREVVGRAVLVHSVDRDSLAQELSSRAQDAEVVQRALLQVNVGDDPNKGGCDPDEALDLIARYRELPNLAVEGLMTIPPLSDDAVDAGEAARPHFRRLRELRDAARERWPQVTHLSMGMSADFETAVAEGATIVRLGTVLFGPRKEDT